MSRIVCCLAKARQQLYRKTKMFMQNLKHKRVHTLLSVLTHDIL